MPEEKASEVQSSSQLRGTVENKAPKPAGLLPKNTQQMVILGVAVVMVLIMWLTGGGKRSATSATAPPPGARVQPPNAATVEDFKQTIQQQQAATRQPISASNLAKLQAMGLAGDVPQGSAVLPPDGTMPQPGGIVGGGAEAQPPPPPDPVKEDKKKREYLSLFAPNVAFTYRKAQEAEQLVGSHGVSSALAENTPQVPATADLDAQLRQAEAQLVAAGQTAARNARGVTTAPSDQQKPASEPERLNADASRPGAFNSFTGKRYVVFEGTILETLLINRLNGSFAGPVDCLVTTDIYSHDRQQVLIPAGTKVLGEAKKVEAFGQQRLAVFFHRLIMPDGYSVNLDQFKGLNQIGETALRDKVNKRIPLIRVPRQEFVCPPGRERLVNKKGSLFSVRNFVQPTRLHVVDKSPYRHALRNPRVRLHFLNLPAHVFLDIAERMEMVRSKGCGSGHSEASPANRHP